MSATANTIQSLKPILKEKYGSSKDINKDSKKDLYKRLKKALGK